MSGRAAGSSPHDLSNRRKRSWHRKAVARTRRPQDALRLIPLPGTQRVWLKTKNVPREGLACCMAWSAMCASGTLTPLTVSGPAGGRDRDAKLQYGRGTNETKRGFLATNERLGWERLGGPAHRPERFALLETCHLQEIRQGLGALRPVHETPRFSPFGIHVPAQKGVGSGGLCCVQSPLAACPPTPARHPHSFLTRSCWPRRATGGPAKAVSLSHFELYLASHLRAGAGLDTTTIDRFLAPAAPRASTRPALLKSVRGVADYVRRS